MTGKSLLFLLGSIFCPPSENIEGKFAGNHDGICGVPVIFGREYSESGWHNSLGSPELLFVGSSPWTNLSICHTGPCQG